MEAAPSTLVDLLRLRSVAHPDREAYVFLQDGEQESERRTYADLDARARALAVRLRERGAAPGDRALLLFPPGLEFIDAFFGCLYAGVVAVPCYPPRPGRDQPRLKAILEDAEARFALGTGAINAKLESLAVDDPRMAGLERIVAETVPSDLAERWERPEISGGTLAFLQYTSGSTSTPKGVMVTHSNLVFMEDLITEVFEQDEQAVVVGWLPVYHDMGLIGNVLQPLSQGARCVLMSPVAFLRRPRRWLEAISRYRGTTSGGPNFAYELCVERISEEERQGLDLSSWRVAFNGAEPVRASTLDRFTEAFAGSGFRREAFRPCYGLAEATLLVSGAPSAASGPVVAEIEEGRGRLVGCGRIPTEQPVAVVDPATGRRCAPGQVGEIWVQGPGVAAGYWKRPEETAETFGATLEGEGPWLRTGDLGFVRDGALFVAGRLKDLIILRGRNHYPQDLELTAERAAPGLAVSSGAAFSVEVEGEERLVIVQELAPRARPDAAELEATAGAIRRAVAEEHEVQVYEVLLVKAGTVPKTTSGKIQRRLTRSLYRDGVLEAVGRSRLEPAPQAAATELDRRALLGLSTEERAAAVEAWMRHKAAEALRVPVAEVDPGRPLIDLGLDSLAAIELGQALESVLGVAVPVGALLEGASLREVVAGTSPPGPLSHLPPTQSPGEGERSSGDRGELEKTGSDTSPLSRRGLGGRWERGPGGEVPLSRTQRGLWFLHRLHPESSAYNLAAAARVHGAVSTSELRASFQGLVDRHPALRTTFRLEAGEPVQVVEERATVAFVEIDARGWLEGELRLRMKEEAWRPFDLERGPLFRVAVYDRGTERLLVVGMHHIVADFGSIFVETPREEARSYADFVAWQEEMLAGPEGERLEEFWRERLAGLPELDLPADRVKPENAPERGGARWLEVEPETLAEIKALARSRRGTLYVALLAAFQALLHRYTGQEDFAVGSPAAGRPAGFGRTFGYFTNPLVLRADLEGRPTFTELVDRARQRVAEALDHQHLPLPLLVERLRPGSELFRALFVLHRGPEGLVSMALGEAGGRLQMDRFELEPLRLEPRAAQFDVTLAAGERRGSLGLELIYDEARFDATTASRWLEHLANLLRGAAERPDAPVAELPLLSAGERHQVVVEANQGSDIDLPWGTLQGGFEQQAERTPEAVALVDGESEITYRELNARASELADRLRKLGVGPETVVGVRLPRTADLVVSLLGVLKAGGAYLPLDPAYPEERVAFMTEDAGAAWTLTPGPSPTSGRGVQVSRFELEGIGGNPHPSPARGRGAGGEGSLAYLIYTSGSTGRPKGVAIEHAAAVRLVAWAGRAFSPEELRGVLAATSVSFDLSVFEIFVPLSFGGSVILAENALALPSLPARDAVTLINTVPSALDTLLDLGPLPAAVRTVNLAGEPLRRALADRILAAGVKLWDLYGPSEDTTYSTGAVIEAGDPSEPLIGWPVAGSRAYVVDRELRPLPLGIPGELCLGGGGLARGYLGRPELTAERFVPDPFGGPGARLYRTGDLARRRSDGALDYLGRLDHQVKIRGFRIELGEVEGALLVLPWVREAVVVAREGSLAAYLSLAGEIPEAPEEALREALREKLPAPFIPSAFIFLEALPRTPNGKVDRKALPAPVPAGDGVFEAPVGQVEETLAAIWADLLDVPAIGRGDRFFEIGGHSLLAARVLARVREALGAEIPLAAFFEEPTLAGLARRIEGTGREMTAPIPRVPRDRPLPLSYAQQRFWFLDRLAPGQATYNVPLALRFRGPLDPAALAHALGEIVRRHEALRTTYVAGEEGPVQRIEPAPDVFPLRAIDLAAFPPEAAEAEERRLELEEARRPFDLERGPLLRGLLLRRGPEEHRLLLVIHHIACDGWSLGILLSDLSSLLAGAPAPEPPLQYADFAAWQRSAPLSEELLATWRERLAGAPALELPVDRPDPARREARGSSLVRVLHAETVEALAAAARREGATLFMALLAGFDALLHRHTGQTDLVVGTATAGRGRADLEKVVGCFVNTLALRIDVGRVPNFAGLITEARSVALAAFRDQDLPFERLVEELHPERDAARRPFPRALLTLQNEPLAPPVLPGIAVEAEPVDTGTSRSDLALSFHEVPAGLLATIELSADVFDEATVARLWERFGVLLAAAAADPSLPLSDLPLLTDTERRELEEWGRARVGADPAALPAVHLFARRAAERPDAVALVDGERSLSFRELNRAANRIAARLLEAGAGPGRIVGLCLDRSAEMVAGLLGIWKAGGAYLPLDPNYPDARLAFLIGDALGGEPIVVTSASLQERLATAIPGLRIVLADQDGEGDVPKLEPVASSGDPAYVIYTSGTTGTPKGVVVEHGHLSALLASVQRAFDFAADDRMPCVAPFSFDIFLFELLAPMLAGGTSILVGLRPSLDVERLVAGLGGMTRLHAVPALMRQILDSARAAGPWPEMRALFVGGDRVPSDLLEDLPAVFPRASVHVLYGPTETTILATWHTAGPAETGSPIGRPFEHAEIVLANAAGRPVPVGVPGEIRIGGAGVARGYLNRPELNAEKFPESSGRRVYRSGDLARWRPDGVLEFLGRADDQVKIRGFRIEPGEIEAALARQPGVREAAVLALEGRLAAFVVPETEAGSDPGGLQAALRAEMPDYMVPGVWRFLPDLPLTVHGKVDRRALAAVAAEAPEESTGEIEAPRGVLEETVAAIFADVLGRERIGRQESFFDLGGHSLLATRVVSRVRAALGAEIPLATVFETPTVAGVTAAVEAARGQGTSAPPLERSPEIGDAPLSFAQQRLWFLDRLDPGGAAYNLPVAVRLRGQLDVPRLESALGEIVRRHEALRTTFHEGENGPVQRIGPADGFSLPVEEVDPESAFRRVEEEAVRPFDLEKGPVFRALLLRLAPEDHLLVVNLHHIVSDGWSMGVLVTELSALSQGASLPELPVQYADWARWQRRWLSGEVLEAEVGWWREALRGLPERLDLPTDHPRRSIEHRRGAKRPVRLGADLTRHVAALARREGTTLFTVVLAGFQALLGRRAGQEDLAVGSPVAGRTRIEVEGLIGFFANTLVLRGDLGGEPDSRELLRRTRRMVLAAHEHQHVPFERLVEELAHVRELGRSPLFEVMLAFQNAAPEPPDLPGVTAELVPAETGTAKFDLLLDLTERDGELAGSLEHDADLFESQTVDRLLAHFAALLRGMTAAPEVPVADLPVLDEAERSQLVSDWSGRAPSPLPWTLLHEGFERQAAASPESVALIWGTERITYGELNERAREVARRLRDVGVGPESVVGISLRRTPELIAAMLGTLQAGAAYVPLDPAYPEERIAFIREDANVGAVIGEGLEIQAVRPAFHRGGTAGEGSLAYLIYTSGSTGRPKGVAIEHASAVRLVAWAGEAFTRDELSRVLAATSVNFDLSIFEIFVPLSLGGAVVLADDALALATLPAAGEVTLINTVPSAMAALLELGPLPSSVRTVNLAGEPLRRALSDRVLATGARLWNLYGPSEDTTYSTGEIVGPGPAEPTIGQPVAGSRAFVTDHALRLQPVGVPGELCLGGGGLARGYLGRPDLTAEKFVPDPLGGGSGARLYRTGDRARWRADGSLEYLGRIDRQVKIRGFRIEPGEIEAVLLAHPDVREAAILPRESSLVAFVVAAGEPDLRAWLQDRLPAALVPSTFVHLERLPLTPNGKVDRAALAGIAPDAPPRDFEAPQGPIEEGLAAIWSEVLGIETIGRQDGFFDRGGHSLLAAQVVSRVRRAFGVEIPLRSLFQEPTLAGLAGRIAAAAGEEGTESLAGAAGEGPAPLSYAQQRLWFLAQLDPSSPVYNLPAAVRLRGSLDPAALERALAEVVRRHESLRTRFPVVEGNPVQMVEESPAVTLPVADLRGLGIQAEAEARRLAAEQAASPFDLPNGPVFRVLLLRLADGEHRLLVNMHHIVSDGWSLGIFVRELGALYRAVVAGEAPPFPDLPVRYRDFAVWQRARLSGETLEHGLAFWREELRGLPPGVDLPTDRTRPPVQTFRGAIRPFALDAAVTGRLRDLARGEGATLFMALLAGFQALLSRWSGQEDLAVGTPVAGRNRLELEGLIGFFINTLVLRGDLSGNPDFRTLVGRARERFLAAQTWQDLPFEKLVEELRPERNLSRPPLFQVLLVLQNAPRDPLALPGLEVIPEVVETGSAKFEIQLTLSEVDGGLAGTLDYNRDLFDAATMDRLLGHYATLLSTATAEPEEPALELEILTPRERQQILREWNPSEQLPRERPIHALFEDQARLRPDAVAVVSEGESLTYGELDRQANALARRLRRLGVGPEERVAICLERSVGMLVGILGILKAGGAYVPLDPEHPAERQSLVLTDAAARVFITQSDLVERLAPPADLPLLLWDLEKEAIASEDGSPVPDLGVYGANAVYVIYTSGSTGRPKGVMLTHAEVVRLLAATDHWFHFGPDDVWALFFSFAFDFSVWEIWGALALGGRLVIVPYWVSRSPAALYELIANEGITVLNQTPSAFRQVVQAEGDLPAPRDLALRWVVFGGEALDPAILGPWFARHGDDRPRMINMYGITETTVHVTWRRMTVADVPKAPVSPVGGPMPDLQLYILDPRQLPLPVGVPGEMCVGGDGLARGYWGRPDLTATRFIPDPFGPRPGARLYRSGDLARLLPDGDIEYLGRIDFQVKIRGFRIELGEIEAVLASLPSVRDAVVLALDDRGGDRRLVAWVVPRNGDLRIEELRGSLRDRLPEYMVPSAFVVLEALPLTANGKLDRRALPEPEARSAAPAVLPRTTTEEAIAEAWREALGLEVVGVEDSFFDLGGHSLLVVQVHRRLAPQFPGLAVVDLFRYPTISALAGYLSKEKVDQISLEETRERAEDRTDRAKRQRELRRQARGR